MSATMRKTGINSIGEIPWGTHFCYFYETNEDLLDILLPYFKAGLANHEYCVWMVPDALNQKAAIKALRTSLPSFDEHVLAGDIEIVPYSASHFQGGMLDAQRVIMDWKERLHLALAKGYQGLRVNGHTMHLSAQEQDSAAFKTTLTALLAEQQMLVAFTYPLTAMRGSMLLDAVRMHHCAGVRQQGTWEMIATRELPQVTMQRVKPNQALESPAFERTNTDLVAHEAEVLPADVNDLRYTESEHSYRELFENSMVGISQALPDGRFLQVNRAYAQMYGYESPEAMVAAITDIGQEIYADSEERQEVLHILATSGKMGPREFRVRRRDGTLFTVLATARRIADAQGNLLYSQSAHIDISEQKQAEEQSRYQANLLANVSDALISTDLNLRIQSWNKAAESFYGWTAEQALGKTMRDLVPTVYLDTQYEDALNHLWQKGQWSGEVIQQSRDGTERSILSSVTVFRNESQQPSGVVAVNRDITARKRLEAENEQLTAQFYQAQKMEAMGQLTAGIAHDFSNLLMTIMGNIEMLQMDLHPADPLYERTDIIFHAGSRAANLIHQLLIFSRKQIMAPECVALNTVITEMSRLLERIIGEHIIIQLHLTPYLWSIRVDPVQIEQVIINLAVNARDAMPDGGILFLETNNVLFDETTLIEPAMRPGAYVVLNIRDTGTGIAQDVQEHLFEPFFTTKGQGKGTGLGLSTVYGIVKQSNGYIFVQSEEGQGASFQLYFPQFLSDVHQAVAPQPTQQITYGQETILLVEDDPAIRKLVRDVLKKQGYTLLEAETGEQALQVVSQYDGLIHLLLTDVILPGMSGKALAEALVKAHPQLSVIYMSGYTDEVISHHGVLERGIVLLQKPFSFADMLRKVQEVLTKRGNRSAPL